MNPSRVWALLDRALRGRNEHMRRDWDRRARADARFFIAGGSSGSDREFWESGERELDGAILRDVELLPGARALEIGCGMGRLLRPLAPRVAKAWGVDISPEMVSRAREALADLSNVEVLPTRGGLAPIPDASLDLVFSFIVFQHIPDKPSVSAYIGEAGRVLKGGGVFRFQVDGRPAAKSPADTWFGVRYEADEIRRELESARFEVVDVWGEGTQTLLLTARRAAEPARPASAAIRVRRRAWSREPVRALLARLGPSAEDRLDGVLRGECSLRSLAGPWIESTRTLPAGEFVERAYAVVLGREADADGLGFYRRRASGRRARESALDSLFSSGELEDRLRPRVES